MYNSEYYCYFSTYLKAAIFILTVSQTVFLRIMYGPRTFGHSVVYDTIGGTNELHIQRTCMLMIPVHMLFVWGGLHVSISPIVVGKLATT